MSISSHALYLAVQQDLSNLLPSKFLLTNSPKDLQLPPDASPREHAAVSLCKSLFKKNIDIVEPTADGEALSTFIRMNDHCKAFKFDLFGHPESVVHSLTWAKTYIDKWINRGPTSLFDGLSWLKDCDFGPGASVGSNGNSFYHKSGCSPLSGTDDSMYSFYIESIRSMPSWLSSEKHRRSMFGRMDVVNGSKLCFVPKSTEISRVICVEPSLNMFIQKGLGSVLERILASRLGFDLEDQQFRNRALARIGSVTGDFGTIDLSSASDTISKSLCDYILPQSLRTWLDFSRSPRVQLPDGSWIEQHMISSMGNATTFPLQTMIFSAIVLGCYKVCGIEFSRPYHGLVKLGNAGVFGDDIIVRKEAYDLVVSSLRACGFFPNENKSFNSGRFRESCGGDYFDGHNVRGVYSKTLKTTHARYSLINRLNVWSARHSIPLTSSVTYLLSTVRFLPVPLLDMDIAGVKVPLCLASVKRNRNGSYAYRRLEARPQSFDLSDFKCFDKNRARRYRISYNADAVLVSAVKGSLRNGSINIRMDVIRPNYRFGIVPCWDYIDQGSQYFSEIDYSSWETMVILNIGSMLGYKL